MSITAIGNNDRYNNKYLSVQRNQNEQKRGALKNSIENSSSEVTSFEKKLEGVINNKISQNTNSVKTQDGIVVSQPPNYSNYGYDNAISNKSKADMSMEEYKQYFMNEMSKIPVSSYYKASFTGSLVITERAFEKMKTDPKWEKTVLSMLREMYSVKGLPQKSYCMQVIGATPEECYGYSMPVDSGSSFLSKTKNGDSWWKKHHEKIMELLEEGAKKSQEEQGTKNKVLQKEMLQFRQIRNAYFDFLEKV